MILGARVAIFGMILGVRGGLLGGFGAPLGSLGSIWGPFWEEKIAKMVSWELRGAPGEHFLTVWRHFECFSNDF